MTETINGTLNEVRPEAARLDPATWKLSQEKMRAEKALRASGHSRKNAKRIVAEMFRQTL